MGGCKRLITSGNIISVANSIAIGGFDERLFIDEVDYDFCYRGVAKGLRLYVSSEGIYLLHSLGNMLDRKFLWRTVHCMNHNRIRKYYIARNRLFVMREHYKVLGVIDFLRYIKGQLRLLFDVLFYEDDKLAKLRYIYYGVRDFFLGRYGKVY